MSQHNPQYTSSRTADADIQHDQAGSSQSGAFRPCFEGGGEKPFTFSSLPNRYNAGISDSEFWTPGRALIAIVGTLAILALAAVLA